MKVYDNGEYLELIPETEFEHGIIEFNFLEGQQYAEVIKKESSCYDHAYDRYWLWIKKKGITKDKIKKEKK